MHRLATLAGFIVVVALVAFVGARFEPGAWHAALDKPSWNPPSFVFAPVWTPLYLMIAVAAWRLWPQRHVPRVRTALWLWCAQMLLNAAWSWLFFGRHLPLAALFDILLLLGVIVAFVIVSWPRDRVAALLFLPYVAWVAFAAALNASIWWLNRG